jgi:hypothetical protein
MLPLKITFTGLLLGVVAALVIGSAEAHDPDHHEQAEWYQSLISRTLRRGRRLLGR